MPSETRKSLPTMKLLSILGPTASGKSSVAIELAHALDGEIISCDSMQLYKGMDIGTAKVTPAESQGVPHHLIDILDLEDSYSVAKFIVDADRCIRQIIAKGKQPILCGGTGLYAKALLYGFDCRPSDREIAQDLRRELEANGPEALLAELRSVAPEYAQDVGDNPRHWLRALEVVRITGTPSQAQDEFHRPDYVAPEFILMPPALLSRERIRKRAVDMLDAGWIDEVRAIADRFKTSATAKQALGYAIVIDHLEGKLTYDDMVERIVTATAKYAKRQRTWFRHQHPEGIAIPVTESDSAKSLADDVLAVLRSAE
jgi:tRNA dimethylallyltransferase